MKFNNTMSGNLICFSNIANKNIYLIILSSSVRLNSILLRKHDIFSIDRMTTYSRNNNCFDKIPQNPIGDARPVRHDGPDGDEAVGATTVPRPAGSGNHPHAVGREQQLLVVDRKAESIHGVKI